MTPSEYIKKCGKHKDATSLEKLVQIYSYGGYEQGMWSLVKQVLDKPSDFDEEEMEFVCDFLAEIQYGYATVIKWRNQVK